MKNIVTISLLAIMLSGFMGSVLLVPNAQAAAGTIGGEATANLQAVNVTSFNADQDPNALTSTVGRVIKIVLGFLGVVLIVIVIYAGFLWMTAGGGDEQTKKAREWLTNAIIGLAIILSAYAITDFVMTKLIEATLVQ